MMAYIMICLTIHIYTLVFANKGDIFNTAYYLNQAYKYSNSDRQREFIDNYVQRISSYLQ